MTRRFDLFLAVLALALVVALAGCSSNPTLAQPTSPSAEAPATSEPGSNAPVLRIVNQGEQDIHKLVVLFPDSRVAFGDIPAGGTTSYMEVPGGVYNYAAYEYEENGQPVHQPVIDWVGESPRPGERFTYVIAYDPSQEDMLAIQLVEVIDE